MIITVGFKKNSGAAVRNFDAVSYHISFETDEFRYTDESFIRGRIISAKHKKWDIRLGMLTESDMDYLEELAAEAAPEMVLESVTYQIEVLRITARHVRGSITVVNRNPA